MQVAETQVSTGGPYARGRVPTAIVAEADRALRDLLRVHLQNAGYNAILAPDAVVAGRAILERPEAIDVLLIDVRLPFMSGIDFVATLIADSSLRFIPTIMIATSEQDAGRADALNVPCLVAPFGAEQLLEVVRRAVQQPAAKRASHEGVMRSLSQRIDDLTVPIPVPRAGRRLRVVIADDEADTVTSLMMIVSHEGHSVFGTHHAPEVLPEVRMNKPDAVILDIDMPGISGYAIARDIRETFGGDSPLLIAVSGKWFSQTDRMLAELAGFDYFMQKPCHPDMLLGLLGGREAPHGANKLEHSCAPSLTSRT